MNKIKIKETLKAAQNGKSALSTKALPKNPSHFDTDRIHPKAKGGTYNDLENVRAVDPVDHMERHGNLKIRDTEFEKLKTLIDSREQVVKLRNSCSNRLLALARGTDQLDEETQSWLNEKVGQISTYVKEVDKRVVKHLKSMSHPIIKSALGVKGVGPITVAYMLVYVDIEKCEYAGNLWSYVGITKPSHQRYEKNVAGGGNKTLRTVLYTMADSMIKTRSPYRDVYDREKLKLENSEKMVESRNTQGKLITCMWKETKPCHRHGAGIRKIIKHFLADWWFVHRSLEGLSITQPYVIEHLGHKDWIEPNERGWEF